METVMAIMQTAAVQMNSRTTLLNGKIQTATVTETMEMRFLLTALSGMIPTQMDTVITRMEHSVIGSQTTRTAGRIPTVTVLQMKTMLLPTMKLSGMTQMVMVMATMQTEAMQMSSPMIPVNGKIPMRMV
jgi:hypothetical protein